jgi:hypothetical protein
MQIQKQFFKESGVRVSHGCHKTFETCYQSCSLFDSFVIQAMAGAQQQFLQISIKNKGMSIGPQNTI